MLRNAVRLFCWMVVLSFMAFAAKPEHIRFEPEESVNNNIPRLRKMIEKKTGKMKYRYYDDEIIVTYKEGAKAAKKKSLNDKISQLAKDKRKTLKGKKLHDHLLKTLRDDPDVISAEPNYIITPQSTAPYYNDPLASEQWYLSALKLEKLWPISQGSANLKIAVADCKINTTHPDLANRNIEAVYFGVENSNSPLPIHHGTGIAAIIGAVSNNSTGISGINQVSTLTNLVVLNEFGIGTTTDLADAIRWAGDNQVKVLNVSAGTYAPSPISYLTEAVDYARARGVIIVASAGNDNNNDVLYPAKTNGVISVGALDNNGLIAPFSNYGSNVDVYAPGQDIFTAAYSDYALVNGTSASTAIVSGYISLLLSARPLWNLDSILNTFNRYGSKIVDTYTYSSKTGNSLISNSVAENLSLSSYTDLAVLGFKRSLDYYKRNTTYSATVVVKNMGTTVLGQKTISGDVYVNDSTHYNIFSIQSPVLGPGQVEELQVQYLFNTTQFDTGSVVVKVYSLFADSNSTNSEYWSELNITDTDFKKLVLQNISITPQTMSDTDTVCVNFLVCNTGTTSIPSFHTLGFISPGKPEYVTAGSLKKIDSLYINTPLAVGSVMNIQMNYSIIKGKINMVTIWLKTLYGTNSVYENRTITLDGKIKASYCDNTHKHLTSEAVNLLVKCGVDPVSLHEKVSKPRNIEPLEVMKVGNVNTDALDDIVFSDKTGFYRYDTHFWNADLNDEGSGGINCNTYSSMQKVNKLLCDGFYYVDGYNANGTKGSFWNTTAVKEYKAGRKWNAYYILGQALHTLQDNTVPAHVHDDSHGDCLVCWDGDDSYEGYMEENTAYKNYTADKIFSQGGRFVDPYQNNVESPVRFLMYSANQIADYMASDGSGENPDDYHNHTNSDADYKVNSNPAHYDFFLQSIYDRFSTLNLPTNSERLHGATYSYDTYTDILLIGKTKTGRTDFSNDAWSHYSTLTIDVCIDDGDYDNNLPQVGDNDLQQIGDECANHAIKASAGLIYWFLVETDQIKKGANGKKDISAILNLLLND